MEEVNSQLEGNQGNIRVTDPDLNKGILPSCYCLQVTSLTRILGKPVFLLGFPLDAWRHFSHTIHSYLDQNEAILPLQLIVILVAAVV